MRPPLRCLPYCSLVVLSGCLGAQFQVTEHDAGTSRSDAGVSQTTDAGMQAIDSGTFDDGPLDAGVFDAGVDGGVLDGGTLDSGTIDGGALDAGPTIIDAGTSTVDAGSSLLGVWTITGSDSRGAYTGEVELTEASNSLHFTRVVHWNSSVTVEDGRELWTVWQGIAQSTAPQLTLSASLTTASFVKSRGALTRTPMQPPVVVTGSMSFGVTADTLTGTWSGTQISATETWSNHRDSGSTPLFISERTIPPAHNPPTASDKSTRFTTFSSFHALPVVQPYTSRADFQAAIHGYIVDKTDAAFYRANPNALRVVNKVIDDISLAETLLRANAYRYSLADKAARFDSDIETRFMDPLVGMVVDGGPPAGPFLPSGDSALWTGTYIAAQAYRYLVTGSTVARDNLLRSLNALLTLQEITGDWTHFARSLRRATGSASGLWHAGTGPFAGLDWLEGGNNDMHKGLIYGYLVSWNTLCGATQAQYQSYCDRIRTNAKHLSDDVNISTALSHWLAAYVGGGTSYRIAAETSWLSERIELQQFPLYYDQGIADWSGTHLTFVGRLCQAVLAQNINLGGNAQSAVRDGIDASHQNVERTRMAVWDLLHAVYGSGGGASSPFLENVRWRLKEIPYPKLGFDIDHRINPDFSLSPYPSLPWKNDWTTYPVNDRTLALNQVPYFEDAVDVCQWKSAGRYTSPSNYEVPGVDFVHIYWLARFHNLISAGE